MKKIEAQTILITGATDGIGKIAARKLADRGCRLLVHGRNAAKLDQVEDDLRRTTGNEKIETYLADFSSLEQVRRLARKVQADHEELDVLINNAGLGFSDEREESEDGYELRFAVNYLAPFLLSHLLLPLLEAAASSRIVNVSSAGQQRINFNDVMLEDSYEAWQAYRQSKLALIMFTFELAEKLKNKNITVNSLHPGTFLDTKMVREADIKPLGTAEAGADAEVYLAVSPELGKVSGEYFDRMSKARAIDQAYDARSRRRLWKLSKEWTGLKKS